jgi:hypothetical protein
MVATPVLLLLHKPPGVALFNTVVNPRHTVVMPVLENRLLTVSKANAWHPLLNV